MDLLVAAVFRVLLPLTLTAGESAWVLEPSAEPPIPDQSLVNEESRTGPVTDDQQLHLNLQSEKKSNSIDD